MPGAILVAVPAFAREDVHQQDIRIGPQPGEVLYGDAAHALRWGRDRSPVMGDAIALGIKQGSSAWAINGASSRLARAAIFHMRRFLRPRPKVQW